MLLGGQPCPFPETTHAIRVMEEANDRFCQILRSIAPAHDADIVGPDDRGGLGPWRHDERSARGERVEQLDRQRHIHVVVRRMGDAQDRRPLQCLAQLTVRRIADMHPRPAEMLRAEAVKVSGAVIAGGDQPHPELDVGLVGTGGRHRIHEGLDASARGGPRHEPDHRTRRPRTDLDAPDVRPVPTDDDPIRVEVREDGEGARGHDVPAECLDVAALAGRDFREPGRVPIDTQGVRLGDRIVVHRHDRRVRDRDRGSEQAIAQLLGGGEQRPRPRAGKEPQERPGHEREAVTERRPANEIGIPARFDDSGTGPFGEATEDLAPAKLASPALVAALADHDPVAMGRCWHARQPDRRVRTRTWRRRKQVPGIGGRGSCGREPGGEFVETDDLAAGRRIEERIGDPDGP